MIGDLSYRKVYFKMTDELLTLRDEGIPIFSLLDVFVNTTDTIYSDSIHCKRSPSGGSLGYKIMAERIAEVIEKTWCLGERKHISSKTKMNSVITPLTKNP